MLGRRTLVLACSAAAVAGGSAVAIAASVADDAKKAETEVLGDAAGRLGVKPDDLRAALSAAIDAQIDKAVKAGKLTQAQADAIKKRRAESGTLLPPGPGFGRPGLRGGPGGPGHFPGGPGGRGHHPGEELAAAAKVLGLSESALLERLQSGKTIAEVAKAEGKDLADVKDAIKKAELAELDAAVKAGRLTDAQRDDIAKDLDARIDDKVNGKFGHRGHGPGGRHHGPKFESPPPGVNPGAAPALPPELEPGAAPAPPPAEEYAPA